MKTLMRLGAVLAAVAFCVPALACSEMTQQTTAEKKAEQPPVASAQPAPAQKAVKKTAKAETKVAKAHTPKVAAN